MTLAKIWRKFFVGSDSQETVFNEPFDQWMRSLKPRSPFDSSEAKEEILVGFRLKMEAETEARRIKPWFRKLAFWR